ncbi:MAG: EVE domain-containing protein [Ignavibacteriae bacterium]|nr:EVE domain-containing protein [Ignavibacteriota bacterium]
MNYWLVVTSPDNFKHDREHLAFKTQGLPYRYRNSVQKMQVSDKVIYYIMTLQKFGATATITGDYIEDHSKLWVDDDEMWPARRSSEPEIVLNDDELIDAKKLAPNLSFIENKDYWGTYLQGSIRQIPEEDFRLIESEMRKVVAERKQLAEQPKGKLESRKQSESDYETLILNLPLETKTLHDRLGEMLELIGSWMDFNTQTRHKITPEHAYELDVAWLSGKNPEVTIEIQISGNLTEAKDRLAQARKFNYRKVILVIRESEMPRLNSLMKHEPDLRSWMEAWSIGSIYEMY